jgi:uncharacterized membrane protein
MKPPDRRRVILVPAASPDTRQEQVMTTFTVWKFDDPSGADEALTVLKDAQSDRLVKVIDHAVVRWPADAARPETDVTHDDQRRGTGWGAFLGGIIGMIFFVPVLGAAVGAGIGHAVKSHDGTAISREELERIREQVTPGTSALFVVTDQADFDRLGERLHGMHQQLLATNLTDAERQVMLETFGS